MDTTPNYGWPFPECDPPLVEDAALIGQLGTLAWAIDDAIGDLAARAQTQLIAPQHARVSQTADVATTDVQVAAVFNSTQFDPNTIVNGAFNIVANEAAWWMVGGYANTTSATAMNTRLRFTLNGNPASSWTDHAGVYNTNGQHPYGMIMVQAAVGDVFGMEVTHNAAAGTAWTHREFLWALKVLAS